MRVGLWRAERALGPGGRGRKGCGETGETPGFGGFPGCPAVSAMLAGFRVRQVRRGMRARAVRGGRCCHFPRSLARRGPSLHFGEAGMGVWGKTWNRAVVCGRRGGSGFSSSAFPDWSPLLSVHSWSRAVVFLTSLSSSCRGSEVRRRGGGAERTGASAQAGGGPRQKRSAQHPHARARHCQTRCVLLLCDRARERGTTAHRSPPLRHFIE